MNEINKNKTIQFMADIWGIILQSSRGLENLGSFKLPILLELGAKLEVSLSLVGTTLGKCF